MLAFPAAKQSVISVAELYLKLNFLLLFSLLQNCNVSADVADEICRKSPRLDTATTAIGTTGHVLDRYLVRNFADSR